MAKPPPPKPPVPTSRYTVRRDVVIAGRIYRAGEVADLAERAARYHVIAGAIEQAPAPAPAPAPKKGAKQ